MDCPNANTDNDDSEGNDPTKSVAAFLAATKRDGAISVFTIVPDPSKTITFADAPDATAGSTCPPPADPADPSDDAP